MMHELHRGPVLMVEKGKLASWLLSRFGGFLMTDRVELCPGDYVTISASRYPFANVMQQGRRSEDWVSSISEKLNWNSRQKQKSFKEWSKDNDSKS